MMDAIVSYQSPVSLCDFCEIGVPRVPLWLNLNTTGSLIRLRDIDVPVFSRLARIWDSIDTVLLHSGHWYQVTWYP